MIDKNVKDIVDGHLQHAIDHHEDAEKWWPVFTQMLSLYNEEQFEDVVNLGRKHRIYCDRRDGWTYKEVALRMIYIAKDTWEEKQMNIRNAYRECVKNQRSLIFFDTGN